MIFCIDTGHLIDQGPSPRHHVPGLRPRPRHAITASSAHKQPNDLYARRRRIFGQRARDKNDKVDSAIFAAVSDMQLDA
jgi:hypothetical protein